MGVLSTIFGTGDVIKKGIDLIDSFHTSDTELIRARSEAKTALMQSYAPFKVAQRYLAVLFAINYICAFWVGVGLWFTGGDVKGFLDLMGAFWVGEIVAAIIGFYFGGGLLESHRRKTP
ncbi:MAG: hypothetical protein ACPGF7_09495 [Pontibacterium sp.]